jgi:hypothetical protein
MSEDFYMVDTMQEPLLKNEKSADTEFERKRQEIMSLRDQKKKEFGISSPEQDAEMVTATRSYDPNQMNTRLDEGKMCAHH